MIGNAAKFLLFKLTAAWRPRATRPPVSAVEGLDSYRAFLDGISIGLYRTSPSGQIVDVNAAMVRILGFPDAATLMATHAARLYAHPDDRGKLREALEINGEVHDLETQLRRYDGSVFWARKNLRTIKNTNGEICYYQGSVEDISHRKLAENALSELQHRLGAVVSNAPLVVFSVDARGIYKLYEGRGALRFGYKPAEVVGRPYAQVHRDSPELLTNLSRALAGEEFSTLIELPESAWELSYAPMRDRQNRITGTIGVGTDVTALRRAENSRDRFFMLARDLIVVVDPRGSMIQLNPAWKRTLGYSLEELKSRHFIEFVHPEDRQATMAQWHNFLLGNSDQPLENRYLCKDGSFRWISWKGVPLPETGLSYYVGRDFTERKLIENELAQARDMALEAARLKSAFLANISHEIRNPLHIIMGYSELVAEHLKAIGDQSYSSELHGIERAGKRLADTIQGLLDFSKLDAGVFEINPEPIRLASFVERLVNECRPFARQKSLELICRIDDDQEAQVTFDQYCLSQALLNLLNNAIKFTHAGSVEVRLYRENDGLLCLAVSDTGVGIDPAYLPRLFEPFSQEQSDYRRNFEGSGLGLALVKSYLSLNGANISVRSAKGQGTCFTIQLVPSFAGGAVRMPSAGHEPAGAQSGNRARLRLNDQPPTLR